MSRPNTIRIAVVSDLHCEVKPKDRDPETMLIAGSLRIPQNRHPVQALIELIKTHPLDADVLVCPGDLANRVCQSGMSQAWDHLKEINTTLNSRLLLPTIGNHDVDSRRSLAFPDPFHIAKHIHPEFPTPTSENRELFWNSGFYVHRDSESKLDFLVMNTVISHLDETSAKRGSFSSEKIAELERFLKKRDEDRTTGDRPPFGIAVMHHHPILHSSVEFGSSDVLEFGDQILDLLSRYNYRFIVHGHRHDPRIRRQSSVAGEQIIFGAGSFSASLKVWSSVTRNLFHLITLDWNDDTANLTGSIRTWEFNYGVGWNPSNRKSATIPHLSGIAIPAANVDPRSLVASCEKSPGSTLKHEDLIAEFPQILNLLPNEVEILRERLSNSGYKILFDEDGSIVECGKVKKR